MPTVSVGPAPTRTAPFVEAPDESGVHDASRFGFAHSDEDVTIAGFLPEGRPLSRRNIRNWTLASLAGGVLLVAAAALSAGADEARDVPRQTTAAAPIEERRGAAPMNVPATAARAVPLEALPRVEPEAASPRARVVPTPVTLEERPRVTPRKTTATRAPAKVTTSSRATVTRTTAKASRPATTPKATATTTAKKKKKSAATTAKKKGTTTATGR